MTIPFSIPRRATAFNALLLLQLAFFASCSTNTTRLNTQPLNRSAESLQEMPIIPGDFADPSIIRHGNTYYATGTSSEWAPHFPLFKSADLQHWQQMGYVFNKTPEWAAASFWAPELYYRNGTYYVYYVARKKADNISCIAVATSHDPAKGFTDRGILLEFGKEAIDPFVIEDKGELYITFKAYGLDKRPIEILGSKLSDDGLKVVGEPFMLLRDDDKIGLEGQCLVKRNDQYYLLYSTGNCCGRGCTYQVEVARANNLQGPYTRYSNNPILSKTEDFKCTGHGTIVTSKQGNDYYLYHAYSKTTDVYTGRQAMLAQVNWQQSGWPAIRPLPGNPLTNFRDDFAGTSLKSNWQWDFRHSQPAVTLKNGQLNLSGQNTADNKTGTAITVRPLSGNYTIETEVANSNSSLKGLVVYGDANQSVGIGAKNNELQLWQVKKDTFAVLQRLALPSVQPVQLRMVVENGYRLQFFWRQAADAWKPLATGSDFVNGQFLPPWDRSPRPGILQQGAEPATFSFFSITYP